MSEAQKPGPARRPALGLAALAATLALVVGGVRGNFGGAQPTRAEALAATLAKRGLVPDASSVVWLTRPPFSVVDATSKNTIAVLRAAPGAQEPNDIYMVSARLSPEGVLLDAGPAYNLTETTAVDELAPVGGDDFVAFAAAPTAVGAQPSQIKLIALKPTESGARAEWSSLERVQGALMRFQETGRLDGVSRASYSLEPAPKQFKLEVQDGKLLLRADAREVVIDPAQPLEVPQWLTAEVPPERRPGGLITWAVDRVRGVVGSEAMQYVKAVAFGTRDMLKDTVVPEKSEAEVNDQLSEQLGAEASEPPKRTVPVDPEIGFPPPPLKLWRKSGMKGEGVWNLKNDSPFIHTLPGLPSTFVTTFIRTDRHRASSFVYIALWDPRLVRLNMMAGVAEPKSATGATGPGLVPREPTVMRRVAAAMNAGFQALHGEYGMMSDGVIYLPPKPYAATVALKRDGSTAFGTWPNSSTIPSDILSYRQNMTVMVLNEKFNPYGRTWWGGTPADWEDRTHTVRTGICLTKEGFVAYFYGGDLSPRALAQSMIQARCNYGLALDMNAGHSGLEFYKVAPKSEFKPLGRGLDRSLERDGDIKELDGWGFRARRLVRGMGLMNFPRYIRREGRDFFYLTLRYVLPGEPVVVADAKGDDGKWQVKGLPQHGFPYALAKTEVPLGGQRVRVLRVDPRMMTLDSKQAIKREGKNQTVMLLNATDTDASGPGLWSSPTAFAIAAEPPVEGAVKLLGAAAHDKGRAAVGVEQASGMLLYLEVVGEGTLPAAELRKLLLTRGATEALVLDKPWPLALGGDTSLAGDAVRLPTGTRARFLRAQGPGGRTIFDDTPIVSIKEWRPLQSRRIRYFKKRK